MKKLVQQFIASIGVLAMAGCTTVQPLTVSPSSLSSTLKPGDQVEVTTAGGKQLKFKVDSVDANGVQGGGQSIAYNDIQSINRKEVDTKRTMWVVLGVVAAGAIAAAAGGGGGGGGNGY
jgi:hypothetical protein